MGFTLDPINSPLLIDFNLFISNFDFYFIKSLSFMIIIIMTTVDLNSFTIPQIYQIISRILFNFSHSFPSFD